MPQEIARQWFVPGEGIDRHVISADIQRYLGNDATVRPGQGTGEHQGVQGYWIKAYRNLTTAMIQDLRADSARWRQEQRQTGTREPYVGSSTHHASVTGRTSHSRRDGESPSLDGPYGLPAASRAERERIPVDTRMQIDPPQPSRGGYQSDSRVPYGQPDSRPFPAENRGYAPDSRSQYQPDTAMSSGFGGSARPAVSAPYGQEPRYAPSYPQSNNDGAPPGYVRQGDYFVPVSSFQAPPSIPARSDNYGPGSFAPPQPGREPRGYQQPDFQDPRYAYPSPAATVSSVSAREREPVSSPPQPSNYGAMPPSQYDNYGGRPPPAVSRPAAGSNPNRAGGVGMFARSGGTSGVGDSRSSRR